MLCVYDVRCVGSFIPPRVGRSRNMFNLTPTPLLMSDLRALRTLLTRCRNPYSR